MSIGYSNSVIAKLGLLLLTLLLMVSCGAAEPTATPVPATATQVEGTSFENALYGLGHI